MSRVLFEAGFSGLCVRLIDEYSCAHGSSDMACSTEVHRACVPLMLLLLPVIFQVDQEALSAAHYLLRPFCLRRLKSEVEVTLPPKVETRIATPLSSQQIFWYRR